MNGTIWKSGRAVAKSKGPVMAKPNFKAVHGGEPHIAAILAADMVGYSQHMCRDETGTILKLRSLRRNLLYPSTRHHGGRVIKSSGDGVLVEFSSTRHAVNCAIEMQRSLLASNKYIDEDQRVFFRMGIGVGDVTVDDDGDIYGNSVNVASRLENIAPNGGICISQAALDQIRGKIQCEFVDLGSVHLKNIDHAVRVFAITPEAIARQASISNSKPIADIRVNIRKIVLLSMILPLIIGMTFLSSDNINFEYQNFYNNDLRNAIFTNALGGAGATAKRITARTSVLIMPFKNPEGGLAGDILAAAVAEDITSDLSRSENIFVFANSIARELKDRNIDPREIKKYLDVRYIFSGTIHHSDGRFRINAQLIDTSTGAQVWADRFKSHEASLMDIEDEIVNRLVGTLTSGISEAENRRHLDERAVSPSSAR
ncbi:adenylate/guanylate cyclase domain-containing protein [Methylobacterium sp. ID0610]|uniref:adenylate/guanylate cyclase domain-containing protein n=1 Tax=Methylobacterium carpenticola TaxID=3344827 RepID=UPI0036AE5FD4